MKFHKQIIFQILLLIKYIGTATITFQKYFFELSL